MYIVCVKVSVLIFFKSVVCVKEQLEARLTRLKPFSQQLLWENTISLKRTWIIFQSPVYIGHGPVTESTVCLIMYVGFFKHLRDIFSV